MKQSEARQSKVIQSKAKQGENEEEEEENMIKAFAIIHLPLVVSISDRVHTTLDVVTHTVCTPKSPSPSTTQHLVHG